MNGAFSLSTFSHPIHETPRSRTYKKIQPNPPMNLGNRHVLIEIDGKPFFFKGARAPQGCSFVFHDLVVELICSKLGSHLGVPVPLMVGHSDPALGTGFGLVSEYFGVKTLSPNDDSSSILNKDEFPKAFVFEQWVLNDDDKKEHFILQPVEDEYRFWIIDHGHSLHAWRSDISPDISTPEPLLFEPSIKHCPYRVINRSEMESGIALVKGMKDSTVKAIVDESFEEIKEIGRDNPIYAKSYQDFYQNENDHKGTILKILAVRKGAIESITAKKYDKFNIP